MPEDIEPEHPGFVVIALNAHGIAEAFGPWDEPTAHRHATFMARLVPTWLADLGEQTCEQYGIVEEPGPRAESLALPAEVGEATDG